MFGGVTGALAASGVSGGIVQGGPSPRRHAQWDSRLLMRHWSYVAFFCAEERVPDVTPGRYEEEEEGYITGKLYLYQVSHRAKIK